MWPSRGKKMKQNFALGVAYRWYYGYIFEDLGDHLGVKKMKQNFGFRSCLCIGDTFDTFLCKWILDISDYSKLDNFMRDDWVWNMYHKINTVFFSYRCYEMIHQKTQLLWYWLSHNLLTCEPYMFNQFRFFWECFLANDTLEGIFSFM